MPKDNLAVAYMTKKRNQKPKGYAKGGEVEAPAEVESEHESMDEEMLEKREEHNPAVEAGHGLEMGAGSEGHQPMDPLHENIVDAIMHARKRMAQGGMVEDAGDSSSVFEPEDAWNQHGQESNLKENYASDLSNEDHDQSLIGQILTERKKKRSA